MDKVFWVIIFMLMIVSCKKDYGKTCKKDSIDHFYQEASDWSLYVDSVKVYNCDSHSVDSIMFCFLNNDAPKVIDKIHVLFWKNGERLSASSCVKEIDGYFCLSKDHYIFYLMNAKSVYLSEISMKAQLECSNEKYVNFTKDPCKQILRLTQEATENEIIYLKATATDICFDGYSDTLLHYKLTTF